MRPYYGRLFDKKRNIQLEKWKISNQIYIKAIELLTTTRDKKGNRFFLDYAALEVSHLGSIYEHLLEYHLTIKKGKISELPSPQDRKSSGSYYTPEYVIGYVVAKSVGPIINKIIEENTSKEDQIKKILELNILDPAIGSGHFLIGTTKYIAKRICEIENSDSQLSYVERKRDVVRRCIYGIDLNQLAVDLSALSLWLETLSSEKPLTFLSAHLKTGNSLMGSEIDKIFENQTTFLESQKGRDKFVRNIKDFFAFENLKDDSPSAVRTKIEKYENMKLKGTIYYDLKFLLDSRLAESFGIRIDAIGGDYRAKIGENSIDFYTYNHGPKVKELAHRYKFFHWELKFSNIFFDQNGNKKSDPGFDIIIGNPPYVKEDVNKMIFDVIKRTNNSKYYQGKMDYWYLFTCSSLDKLRNGGYLSFIAPNNWITNYGASIMRNKILSETQIVSFFDFNEFKVFKDASIQTMIFVPKRTIVKVFTTVIIQK